MSFRTPATESKPVAYKAGLTKRATCHTFRHSFASIRDRPELAARSTDFEAGTEDDMPIRIKRRDNQEHR